MVSSFPEIQQALEAALGIQPDPIVFRLNSINISLGYRPDQSLVYSILGHIAAVVLVLFFPLHQLTQRRVPLESAKIIDLRQAIYLPELGGGNEGDGREGGSAAAASHVSRPMPTRRSKGYTYPGPQPILSEPPRPTNPVQTILRPAVEKPRILEKFVPVPNMVKTANAGPPLPIDSKAIKPVIPVFNPPIPATVEAPKLTFQNSASKNAPKWDEAEPIRTKVEEPKQPRKPDLEASLPTRGRDTENLVALSAVPPPPDMGQNVPLGEARGRFAVSPDASITDFQPGPGSKANGPVASASGISAHDGSKVGNATDDNSAGEGNLKGTSAAGASGGAGTGTAETAGAGNGGPGKGIGRGSAIGLGPGVGIGPGNGSGTGVGEGNGRGMGAFKGITIQGGSLGSGTGGHLATLAPNTSYNMTIVATAGSGGGLADFGVFSHEKVYTVYLDMRRDAQDHSPSWTLQYAVLPIGVGNSAAAGGGSVSHSQEGLAAPFPLMKGVPQLPAELARKNLHKVMVVYAVMSTEGKLEQIAVKRSPAADLDSPMLEALKKWQFKPAELRGQPVSVKVLLGIPVALSD